MQINLHRRSRPEEFLGPFFLATAGVLATGPQRHGGTALLKASRGLMAAQDITGPHGGAGHHEASCRHRFWLQGRFWLQLWLQLWLQDFPRTAMFFYRFICFISLVTNVTKKSLKSF